MKTHTQYPYPITTVEQLRYAVENNLIVREIIKDNSGKVIVDLRWPAGNITGAITESLRHNDDPREYTIVPKTIDELENDDMVEFLGEKFTVEFFSTDVEFYSEGEGVPSITAGKQNLKDFTFSHPLPIDLFPILDKE